jgi:hypothetical protein
MAMSARVFRFTIGQGMAVIAALAVIFAFVPMPAAIFLILITLLLVLHLLVAARRTNRSIPSLGERIGCLSCFAGFLGGAIVGVSRVGWSADYYGLNIGFALCCGFLGALIVGIVGHFVALALPREPLPSPSVSYAKTKREAAQAEIELVERLLVQAAKENDEEVRTKLAAYHAGLVQVLLSQTPTDVHQ